MRRTLLALVIVLLASGLARAAAVEAPAVVQRLPVGPFEYVLHANGNIYMDNGLFRKVLDDGTGTIQMAGERNNLFILKSSSQIWYYDGSLWTMLDDGEATVRIGFADGTCYAFKKNGDVWRCALAKSPAGEWAPTWSKVEGHAVATRIENFKQLHGE